MSTYHDTRFEFDPRRDLLWQTLCRSYFSRLIDPDFHVLDLGAGYAHFINNIECKTRTAVDVWEMLPKFTAPGVSARVGSVTDLHFLPDRSVDFVFASNVFEHLAQSDLAAVLEQLRRKLSARGTLNILQPNYKLCYRDYFDDYTHVAVYTHVSLCDFLRVNGFKIVFCEAGFLPFSIKSRFPVSPALIRLYLRLPWKPLAKQMFIRASLA